MKILMVTAVLLLSNVCFAQKRGKTIFLEVGGPGNLTLNYDMRFTKSRTGFGTRIGLGWFSFNTDQHKIQGITIPLELNYFFNLKDYLLLETGGGLVFQNVNYDEKSTIIDHGSSALAPYIALALRLSSKSRRFIYRAAFTPVFGGIDKIESQGFSVDNKSTFGASFGVNLGKK